MQTDCPVFVAVAQKRQEVWPMFDWYVNTEQLVHVVDPETLLYFPAGHCTHEVDAEFPEVRVYVPTGQFVQDEDVKREA
jgi:hypothetical protein